MLFTPPPVDIACGILAGMGALVQLGLGFITGNDKVQEKLDLLTKKMEELDKQIQKGFNDMKAFITENKFSEEIINDVSTLKKLWNDCFKVGTPATIEAFRLAYEQKTPLNMVYMLKTFLDHKFTNPLKMSIEKEEKDKKHATFKKWEKIILTIVGDLKMLESFACGLFKNKNLYDCRRIIAQEKEINDCLIQWRQEYLDDYWKEMKDFLEHNVSSESNDAIADKIADKLKSYETDDSFYIFVFNECKWQEDYTYYCDKEDSNIIGVWHSNGKAAFIYRSPRGTQKYDKEYDQIQSEVESCRNGKLVYDGGLGGVIRKQLLETKTITNSGFIGLFWKSKDVKVRSVNCPKREWGPGWWISANVKNNSSDATYDYYLVAAFD